MNHSERQRLARRTLRNRLARKGRLANRLFELLEPRVMLAADLQYPPNPLVTDITLQAVQNASPPVLQLMQTGTGNLLASVTLDEASDNHIRIRRSDLPELFGDRLRISLGSLTTLQTFVVNSGGSLVLDFDGGLETPLTEDSVWLEGSGQYTLGFGLEVRSTSDVQILAGSPTITGNFVVDSENAVVVSNTQLIATNISLLATPSSTGTGDASDPQKVLSLPSATITMTSGTLTAANITLAATATTNIQIQSESILGGAVSVGEVVVLSDADVEIGGTASISASSSLNVSASSTVTTVVARKPQADGNASDDKEQDAAVAVSVVTSSPSVVIQGNAVLVSNGTMNITSTNANTITTIADGTIGDRSAGGTLATAVVIGDNTVLIAGAASVTAQGNLTIAATSTRDITTTSKSTPEGATEDGTASNTKGQQTLADNDASTSDGDMSLAAAVTVVSVSGDTSAQILGGTVKSIGGNLDLLSTANHTVTAVADGTYSTGSNGSGVGVAAAIQAINLDSLANVGGSANLDGNTIRIASLVNTGNSSVSARSGQSGDGGGADLGIAGSLGIAVDLVISQATISPSAVLNVNGANLTLNAVSNSTSTLRSLPAEAVSGQSIGVGASYALNVVDRTTKAMIENSASISNVNNLTVTALSDNDSTTEARAGASGGTAVSPAVAHEIANLDTFARLGTGNELIVPGSLVLNSSHTGDATVTADGDAEGGTTAAVGAAIALGFLDETTEATTSRNLNVLQNLTITSIGGSSLQVVASASAGGATEDSDDIDTKSATNRTEGDSRATSQGARSSSGNQTSPTAGTSDGPVAVAAAVALNVTESVQRAFLPSNRVITVGGNSIIRSTANLDTTSRANGQATSAGSVGVGAAVAINLTKLTNEAYVDAGTTLNTDGLVLEAVMTNVGGNTTHAFTTEAVSGSGDGDVSVAGSVAINLIDTQTLAEVRAGATIGALTNQPLTVRAAATSITVTNAKPESTMGNDVGIGGSFALTRTDQLVSAKVDNTVQLLGTAQSLTIEALANHQVDTLSSNGAAGDIGIGAAIALVIVDHDTHALLGTGNTLNLQGAATIKANHNNRVNTKADAEAAGSNVGVGASVGISDVDDSVSATLARSLIGAANLSVLSESTASVSLETKASAKGNSASADSADSTANKQRNQSPNRGSNSVLPSAASQAQSASSKSSSQSSSGSSGVGVAATVSINVHNISNQASIVQGADVSSSGSITVSAKGHFDASSKAHGTAVTLLESNNIGAAVALNFANATNRAVIDSGSVIQGNGVTVEAVTTNNEVNQFTAWGAAAGGGRGDVGIAGSVGINVVTFTSEASTRVGSHVKSTGSLTVQAETDLNPQVLAAGGGFSNGQSVGAAVAIGTLDITTLATIDGNADASNQMLVRSQANLRRSTMDLPSPIPDVDATSIAVAGGASSGGVGIAGAVVINDFDFTTHALIHAASQINQDAGIVDNAGQTITIEALDNSVVTSFAGSLGLSSSNVGVGAGLDVGILSKNTQAVIGANTLVGSRSNVIVRTVADETLTTLAVNGGVGNSVGIAASASIYVLNTTSTATIGDNAVLNSQGAVSVLSNGIFKLTSLAGSVGIGGTAGVGAANVTILHSDLMHAGIGAGSNITAEGSVGLSIAADSREEIIGVSAAGAGAGSAAIAGSATVLVLDETTLATIGRSAIVDADNGAASGTPNVVVTARDATIIVTVAGSLAASGSAAVGAGADVADIAKVTTAYIDSGTSIVAEGNIVVTSDSSEDITSVAAGLAAAGNAAVAADAGVHAIEIVTRAFVGDDPNDAIASLNPTTIFSKQNVVIAADDVFEVDKVVSALAAAAYAGVGVTTGVTNTTKTTEAFVGAGVNLTSLGLGPASIVRTGEYTLGAVGASSSTPGVEANGGVSLNSNASSLSASGEVGLPNFTKSAFNVDRDSSGSSEASDPSLSSQRTVTPATKSHNGLAVTATSRSDVEVYTISFAGGLVAIGLSAGISDFDNSTRSYIGEDAVINFDLAAAGSA